MRRFKIKDEKPKVGSVFLMYVISVRLTEDKIDYFVSCELVKVHQKKMIYIIALNERHSVNWFGYQRLNVLEKHINTNRCHMYCRCEAKHLDTILTRIDSFVKSLNIKESVYTKDSPKIVVYKTR